MSFNPMMAKAVTLIRTQLGENPTVLELGSQTLTTKVDGKDIQTVPEFYELLGFSKYDSVDFDGKGTIQADLNDGATYGPYDFVTNNGTGEHIFDQAAIFNTCHESCKQGGIMLHVMPWINWRNHGFYNFNPILYRDIAYANNYEILQIYAGDRNGHITHGEIDFSEEKSPSTIDKNIMIVCAMRKNGDEPFRYPTQGKYQSVRENPYLSEDYKKRLEKIEPQNKPIEIKGILSCMEEIKTEPFVHAVGKLDDNTYRWLWDNWPQDDYIMKGRQGDNVLLQWHARESMGNLHPAWEKFVEFHTSQQFFQDLIGWCGPYLPDKLRQYPLQTGVRGRDQAPFLLDAMFCVDTPVKEKTQVRGMHVDNPKEFFKFLIRFPGEDKTYLTLGEWIGEPRFEGKAEAVGEFQEYMKLMDEPGRIIFFLNSPKSLHEVGHRKGGIRRYFNILGEAPEPLFELPR